MRSSKKVTNYSGFAIEQERLFSTVLSEHYHSPRQLFHRQKVHTLSQNQDSRAMEKSQGAQRFSRLRPGVFEWAAH
jgi:hypothetical protein